MLHIAISLLSPMHHKKKNYDSKLKYSQTMKVCGWADSETKAENSFLSNAIHV